MIKTKNGRTWEFAPTEIRVNSCNSWAVFVWMLAVCALGKIGKPSVKYLIMALKREDNNKGILILKRGVSKCKRSIPGGNSMEN